MAALTPCERAGVRDLFAVASPARDLGLDHIATLSSKLTRLGVVSNSLSSHLSTVFFAGSAEIADVPGADPLARMRAIYWAIAGLLSNIALSIPVKTSDGTQPSAAMILNIILEEVTEQSLQRIKDSAPGRIGSTIIPLDASGAATADKFDFRTYFEERDPDGE